jgi:hypothetical protein
MKRLLLVLLFPLCLLGQTRAVINTGTNPNDGTGDTLRTFGLKSNTNFSTLWASVYTNGVTKIGTNVVLAGPTVFDGNLTNSFDFDDINQLNLDGINTEIGGVRTLFLDGGITTLRGVTNLNIITPAVTAGTATTGQALVLTDAVEGTVEFQTVSGGGGSFNPTNLVLYGASLTLPSGTTAERPGSPTAGMVRYNTTTGRNEMYESGTWYQPARVGEFDGNYVSFATNQSLTVGQVNQARANLKREDRSFLLIKGVNTWGITSSGRTSNIVTLTLNKAHGAINGQKFNVVLATNSMLNATEAVMTVGASNILTYTLSGTNVPTATEGTTGTYTVGWEVVNDSGHAPWGNPFIQAITTSQITIAWDTPAAGSKVLAATVGNHANSAQGKLWPVLNGVGANTVNVQLRHQETVGGRVYWNGTTTGGGITANANWVKEGDSTSASFVASTLSTLFIGHGNNKLPTQGSRGPSSWPPPVLTANSGAIRCILPNFQVSPFTVAAYQPASTGFYMQFVDSSGTIMDQTALEAISPASGLQLTWSRTVDTLIQDHTAVDSYGAFTMWLDVQFLLP